MTDTIKRRNWKLHQISDPKFFTSLMQAFYAGDPLATEKLVESSNVECLQLIYHGLARREFDRVIEMCTEDVQFEILGPPNIPFVGRWSGREEMLTALKENFSTVQDQKPEIENLVAQGNTVIVIANETGQVAACGSPYQVRWVQEFTFVDGLVSEVREILDSAADFPAK